MAFGKRVSQYQQKTWHTSDDWLTPISLIKAGGIFDLDPCCPKKMPWKTAKKMIHYPDNGLTSKWYGRIWCNPPYSNVLLWAEKMQKHNNGLFLVPAKSTDTRWGQICLNASAILFFKGRLLFHYKNGKLSTGKWMSNMLVAFGKNNIKSLIDISKVYPGIIMRKIK